MVKWVKEKLQQILCNEKGMTLIELVAVIVIIGIIAAVAVPLTLKTIDNSKVKTALQNEAILQNALERYGQDHNGSYPTPTNGDLSTALQGYLNTIPNNPWTGKNVAGTDYIYNATGNGSGYTLDINDGGQTATNHNIHCSNTSSPSDTKSN